MCPAWQRPPQQDPPGLQKAAKADDVVVPVHLWNDHVREGSHMRLHDQKLDLFWACALRYWKQLIARGFARQCKRWQEEAKGIGQ